MLLTKDFVRIFAFAFLAWLTVPSGEAPLSASRTARAQSSGAGSGSSGVSCEDAFSRLAEALGPAGRPPMSFSSPIQESEQGIWTGNFIFQALNRLPQCASDPGLKEWDDLLAEMRQECRRATSGPANCNEGVNHARLDDRQAQAVAQQLMGAGAVAEGQATGSGTAGGSPSQCGSSPADAAQQFDVAVGDWRTRNPIPTPPAGVGSGAQAQYQWSYFFGVEVLKILERFRPCMSPADYNANKRVLEGARDAGFEGCRKLSNDNACALRMPN
jgi:hypothetical protein